MKTILVATDYSSVANNAVEFAANLARDLEAELILFNVYKVSIHASNSLASSSTFENIAKRNEERLKEYAQDLENRFDVKVNSQIGKDDTVESLRDCSLKLSADLLVMGIESNLTEYKLFGNTTTSAIKLMQIPILIIPNDIQYNGIHKITYACDVSYLNEACQLSMLKDFVKSFNASLEILHVLSNSESQKNEELEQRINNILSDFNHSFVYEQNSSIKDGIELGLEKSPTDLLVMVPHKLGFFESIIKGSYTRQLALNTRVPMLAIPNDQIC